MARSKKLVRSQNAHWTLKLKASDIPGKRGEILFRYHRAVLGKQKIENKILPLRERRKLFTLISKRVKR